MLKKLKEIPLPDEGKREVAIVAGFVSFVIGWLLSVIISQVIFGAAVFMLLSELIELEKQRVPGKHTQGFFGLGPNNDDMVVGAVAFILFLAVAHIFMLIVPVAFTIIALWSFMELEAHRRWNEGGVAGGSPW
jgi:uncharacterized membrane protein YfhO